MRTLPFRQSVILLCFLVGVVGFLSCSENSLFSIKDHPECCIPEKAAVVTATNAYTTAVSSLSTAQKNFNVAIASSSTAASGLAAAITTYVSTTVTSTTLDAALDAASQELETAGLRLGNAYMGLTNPWAAVLNARATLNQREVSLFTCNLHCHNETCCVTEKTSEESARLLVNLDTENLNFHVSIASSLTALQASVQSAYSTAYQSYTSSCPMNSTSGNCLNAIPKLIRLNGFGDEIGSFVTNRTQLVTAAQASLTGDLATYRTRQSAKAICVSNCSQ